MSKFEKLLRKLASAEADANFTFDDLCLILLRLGFEERTRGSHHIFTRPDVEEQINLQRSRSRATAKPYQVAQVRRVIEKYALGGNDADR